MSSHLQTPPLPPSSPPPQLPLECLQFIIQHIADKEDLLTLTTLLRVNRYVCDATLPFLYRDPFKISNPYKDVNRRRLAQTLLRQAPPERISDLVRATIMEWPVEEDETNENVQPTTPISHTSSHDDKSKETYPPPVVNYLSHIRHLDIDYIRLYYTYYDVMTLNHTPAHIRKYVDDHNLAEELHHKSIDCLSQPYSAHSYIAKSLQELIKADLQWALCNPNQIQSLNVPLSHIKLYMDGAQDFKTLSSIRFLIHHTEKALLSLSSENAHVERIYQEWISNIQDMVRFVEKHTSLHKGVLQLVDCPSIVGILGPSLMTKDLRSRLLRCHPPLLNPRSLDCRNWRQFMASFEDTNLEYVESVECSENWREELGSFADTFLQRCRSLKRLTWTIDCNDFFEWAMDEKRQHDADLVKGLVPKPLVSLKEMHFSIKAIHPGREIDDATIAFGDTLESLSVAGCYPYEYYIDPPPAPPQLRYGQGWYLPRLSLLESRLQNGTLHIAPEALVGCRSLVNLVLHDGLMEYDHHQVQSWLPSEHPSLKKMVLIGTPALSFHPDTLHTTPNLDSLWLSIGRVEEHHYIPPAEELEADLDNNNNNVDGAQDQEDQPSVYPSRPRWTWDWHLPNLTKLDLGAEFAYRFQFRMLQKCPRLEDICLNMSTNAGIHGRVVTLDDLSSEDGYMKLPHLKSFYIIGAWHMENEVLRVLFHEVAPNTQDLVEQLCTGFDLNGWMEATSGLHQLKASGSTLDVIEQELVDVGLEPFVEPHVWDQKSTVIACFDFYSRDLRYFRVPPAV